MRLKHELFEQRNQGESTINVIRQRIPQKLNEKKAFKSVETGEKNFQVPLFMRKYHINIVSF